MKKKYLIYCSTQLTGILIFFVPYVISIISMEPSEKTNGIIKWHIFDTASLSIVSFIIVAIYSYTIKKKLKYFILTAILTVLAASAMWVLVNAGLKWFLWKEGLIVIDLNLIRKLAISNLLVFLYLTSIYLFTYYLLEYRNEKEKALKAALLANEAQLKMLEYQINPHFLFNTISSVLTLINENPEIAKQTLQSFAEYFRYTLTKDYSKKIKLSDELNAAKIYLDIQKIRFEERIVIEYDVDKKAEDLDIPFFIIISLVENAVKYGIKTSQLPLKIKIKITVQERCLNIVVSNSGKILTSEVSKVPGTKLGNENIKQRLEFYYNGKSDFNVTEEDGYVNAIIKIKDIEKG